MTIMGTKTITIDDPFAGGTMRNVWPPVNPTNTST